MPDLLFIPSTKIPPSALLYFLEIAPVMVVVVVVVVVGVGVAVGVAKVAGARVTP